MKNYRFEIILAAISMAIFVAFNSFHNPSDRLTPAEVERYMATLQQAPWPEEELAEMVRHMRAWGEADDGGPVYMLNLMRYHPELLPLPAVAGFEGGPAEANAYYEENVTPVMLRLGGYPVFASSMQGVLDGEAPSTNLLTFDPAIDNWDSVLIVRYPSRRRFFELLSDPEYIKYMPYKAASVMVALTPMKGDVIVPPLNWVLGVVLLIMFFALAWLRAARRARANA